MGFQLVPKSVTLNDLERRNVVVKKVHVRYPISWWVSFPTWSCKRVHWSGQSTGTWRTDGQSSGCYSERCKNLGLLVQRRATKMLDGFENLTYKVILQQLKLTFLEKQETASCSHRHNNCQARKRSTWTVSSHWTRIFTAQEVTLTDWKSIERSRLELIKNFFSQQVVPHCQKPLSRLRQLTASTSRIGFDRCVE